MHFANPLGANKFVRWVYSPTISAWHAGAVGAYTLRTTNSFTGSTTPLHVPAHAPPSSETIPVEPLATNNSAIPPDELRRNYSPDAASNQQHNFRRSLCASMPPYSSLPLLC